MSTDKQINANRENAQHSTGPTSEEGKEISSFNRFKHGLCGRFMMIAGESQQDFNRLLTWLLEEHTPVTTEETIIVSKMAEHFWLNQRAQTLGSETLNAAEYDGTFGSPTKKERDQNFIVYMRYASSHERGYQGCQDKLIRLRAQRAKEKFGFERLEMEKAREKRKQEAHESKMRLESAQATKLELENEVKKFVETRLPRHTAIPFKTLKKLLGVAIENLAVELDKNPALADRLKAA